MAENKGENKKDERLYILVFVIVIVLWIIGFWWPVWLDGYPEKIGERGDMYGAVNALFSGLAFGLLFVAIRLQSKELGLQREELIEARKVAEQGIKEQQIANENAKLNIQTKEREMYITTLNNLLTYYTETQRYHWERYLKGSKEEGDKSLDALEMAGQIRVKLEKAVNEIGGEI